MDKPRVHWPSVAQFVLSLVAIAILWGLSFTAMAWALFELVASGSASEETLLIFMTAIPLSACGLLVLPSVYHPFVRTLGRKGIDSRAVLRKLHLEWWILALPIVILVGHVIAEKTAVAWLFLPSFHLLAIGIPTAWMLYLAIHKLPKGSAQRMWGVFDSGLTLAPFLIMLFEVLLAAGFVILFVIYLAIRPELAERLQELSVQLRDAGSPDAAIKLLGPVLAHPLVIASVILFGAVLVPMVEEIFKPIGVWLLVGRKMTPAAGFAAGALSGAGYGFIESLVLTSSGQGWSALVLARIGTSSVHILTSALTGWALVQAWQRRRFLRLGLAYLCAIMIHGLWNGLTLLYSYQILESAEGLPLRIPLIGAFGSVAPFALILLASGCFFGLIAANRALRRSAEKAKAEVEPGSVGGGTSESAV